MSNFAYMSGTGNDFIVSTYTGPTSEIQIISLVADSDYDVDGVIFVEPLDDDSVKMHYFNGTAKYFKWHTCTHISDSATEIFVLSILSCKLA